ncbi:MAG TPA: hypothetical protein VH518_07100 [Tepidisphaeraceae bacterium]|jgi:cellobiose phosphorylase
MDASAAAARDPIVIELHDESAFQCRSLRAGNDLHIQMLPGGCIYSIEHKGILLNEVLASPLAGDIHSVYLRIHDRPIRFVQIVGPSAASEFSAAADRFVWSGAWQSLHYRCTCWLAPDASGWFFHVEFDNRSSKSVRCDAVILQDLGLATRGHVRNNELFTSQYLDHRATHHPEFGHLLMTRQNLPQPGQTHPWLLQGCFPSAAGYTTDGLDFFGVAFKDTRAPAALSRSVIGDRVRQYEAAYTALQSRDFHLEPSQSKSCTFFTHIVSDHHEPSSSRDLDRLRHISQQRDRMLSALAAPAKLIPVKSAPSVFQTCEAFHASDLSESDVEKLFPQPRRHIESADGKLLSFFHGGDSRHVVLKAKELTVARPHGHIMRAGQGLMPDAQVMSCTCYAAGIFASSLALGNTSFGKLLSRIRDPLDLIRSSGLRLFARDQPSQRWQILGVASAFEMAVESCRWFYRHGEKLLTVTCRAADDDPAFTFSVRSDSPVELLVCGEISAGAAEYESSPRMTIDRGKHRMAVRPDPSSLLGKKQPNIQFHLVTATPAAIDAIGGDELLFDDSTARRLPYFALRTHKTTALDFTILGTLDDDQRAESLCAKYETTETTAQRTSEVPADGPRGLTAGIRLSLPSHDRADCMRDTLTWFALDALIHLSTPRGLDQPNGGAWGVRDVCQGAIEFLLSYDHRDVAAQILRHLFAQQYLRRGDWPQWFMFPPYQEIQSTHCHGDVLIWPLKALCDYLEHTNDPAILQERLSYTDEETFEHTGKPEPIVDHVDRLIDRIRQSFLPGTSLPRFGEGDWDDSLQPADPALRERMVSSWTAELMCQTLRRYGEALAHFDLSKRAASVQQLAAKIEADIQRHLIPDGVIAGFALFEGDPPRPVEYLLHPSDTRTSLKYRLIPMTRGILSEVFSRPQAEQHIALIHEHLLFPDGAHLMDRPTTYQGGLETTFRRSESAAFFGREIGLQYVHAHLRYAEALAKMGRADELWHALLVVNPIAVTDLVPNARARQRNTYFSSSDAAFADRYEASRDYEKLRKGLVPVDGGWRIYSSGPGIYTNLIIRHLLGLRRHFDWIEFDPVLPRELDGATCELTQNGRRMRYQFSVRDRSCSPRQITINGSPTTSTSRAPNPYRPGALRILASDFDRQLTSDENLVQIDL